MSIATINVAVNPLRVAQVVAGGAAVFGGYRLASDMVEAAFRADVRGDRERVVATDGNVVIFQPREPQGAKLSNLMMGAGAASAFIGGALALGAGASATGIGGALRSAGGIGLFALGVGAIAGATAGAAQFSNSDFYVER